MLLGFSFFFFGVLMVVCAANWRSSAKALKFIFQLLWLMNFELLAIDRPDGHADANLRVSHVDPLS